VTFLPPDSARPGHRLAVVAAPALTLILVVGSAGAAMALTGDHGTTKLAAATATTSTKTAANVAAGITTTGTLSASSASVVQGATITFNYSTPAATVNSENWVGLYSNPGKGPVNQTYVGASTAYDWAPSQSGTASFSTAALTPGNYIAYFLYDNGYTWLAQPVTFTVTAASGSTSPTTTGTLSASVSSVVQGATITFNYSTPAATVNSENWVGLYSNPGDGPVNQTYVGASTIWNWTASESGTTSFNTASLSPGNYIAYYLYDNGYTWLAQPVTFTVTAPVPVPPPVYTTEFGSGTLKAPSGIALDSKGDVWVSDTDQNRVVEFTSTGTIIGSIKPSGADALDGPTAIALDAAGNVYVADTGDNRVIEFTSRGAVIQVFGTASGSGELNAPTGVAVTSSGTVLVSDTGNNRVVEFTAQGVYSSSFDADMGGPAGIAIDSSGDIWVANSGLADAGPDEALEYSASGTYLGSLGGGESSALGGLSDPSDVAVDASGHAFVADPDYGWVEEFDTDGPYLNEFGDAQPGLLAYPQALAVDAKGDVFVADTGDNQIVEFSPQS